MSAEVTTPIRGETNDDDSSQSRTVAEEPKKLTPFKLALFVYFLCCGGPFGCEEAVKAGGLMLALIAFLSGALFYGIPQSIVAGELSCMMPHNGGSIIWVRHSFGPLVGWVNALNTCCYFIVNELLYIVLGVQYLEETGLELHWMWVIKVVILLAGVGMSVRGLDVVTIASAILAVLISTPFIIIFILSVPEMKHLDLSIPANKDVDWGLIVSDMLWLYSGMIAMGAVAGEVRNPRRGFTIGTAGVTIAMLITYILPTIAAAAIEPEREKWTAGLLARSAAVLHPALGWSVRVASVLTNAGMYTAILSSGGQAVAAAASGDDKVRVLHPFFSKTWKRYGTPAPAIVLQAALGCALLIFDFAFMLQLVACFTVVMNALLMATFLRLRHREPAVNRVVRAPGGWPGAILLAALPTILSIGAFALISWTAIIVGVATNILFILSYYVRLFYLNRMQHRKYSRLQKDGGGETEGDSLDTFRTT